MAKKADVRTKITLECTECKHRNYDSYKNKRNDPDRLTMSKYCPFCKNIRSIKKANKRVHKCFALFCAQNIL